MNNKYSFSIYNILIYIAELYPLGRSKFAPGTVASFFTILLGYFLLLNLSLNELIIFIIFINIIAFISIKFYLNKKNVSDPKEIVIDELSGQLISLLTLPILNIQINFTSLLLAFLTFRFFDITKIGLKKIEKISGPLGVLLDDVFAGIYSFIIQYIFWKYFYNELG